MSVEPHWVDTESGYALALVDGKVVCKNAKGKILKSVPKKARDTEAASMLKTLSTWMQGHQQECQDTVQTWMLRSLPVPADVVAQVWPDPAWRGPLENTVVCAWNDEPDVDEGGFLRGVDPDKGIGVVDLDGETQWLSSAELFIPHPILLGEDLEDYRELATELEISQGIDQLFRETFDKPELDDDEIPRLDDYAYGRFEMLTHALSRARRYGYAIRGGYATCGVWEDGVYVEGRFWLGADSPEWETHTGELLWVNDRERALRANKIGPVAWSEGVRMASLIYAGRVVEKEEGEE